MQNKIKKKNYYSIQKACKILFLLHMYNICLTKFVFLFFFSDKRSSCNKQQITKQFIIILWISDIYVK